MGQLECTAETSRKRRSAPAQVSCPHCGYAYSRQNNARRTEDGYMRKRECMSAKCGRWFNTFEIHAGAEMKVLRALRRMLKEGDRELRE